MPNKQASEINYKHLLLDLMMDLSLCDHMGDVGNNIDVVMMNIGLPEQKIFDDGEEYLHFQTIAIREAGGKYSHERPDGYYGEIK